MLTRQDEADLAEGRRLREEREARERAEYEAEQRQREEDHARTVAAFKGGIKARHRLAMEAWCKLLREVEALETLSGPTSQPDGGEPLRGEGFALLRAMLREASVWRSPENKHGGRVLNGARNIRRLVHRLSADDEALASTKVDLEPDVEAEKIALEERPGEIERAQLTAALLRA